MKLLIEIDEEQYNLILKSDRTNNSLLTANSLFASNYAIKNGKPLDAVSREAALRQAINAHKMAQENGFDFKDDSISGQKVRERDAKIE